MDTERRDTVRVRVNEEFAEIAADLPEYVEDLSPGGVFLRCEERVPLGTEVDLHFTVLTEGLETVVGRGVVVHHGTPERPGLGIRFLSLTDESRRLVDRLVATAEGVRGE